MSEKVVLVIQNDTDEHSSWVDVDGLDLLVIQDVRNAINDGRHTSHSASMWYVRETEDGGLTMIRKYEDE